MDTAAYLELTFYGVSVVLPNPVSVRRLFMILCYAEAHVDWAKRAERVCRRSSSS